MIPDLATVLWLIIEATWLALITAGIATTRRAQRRKGGEGCHRA